MTGISVSPRDGAVTNHATGGKATFIDDADTGRLTIVLEGGDLRAFAHALLAAADARDIREKRRS